MQCTPESNVYFKSCKGGPCYDDGVDSGYSGLFHSPQSTSGDGCLSVVEQNETPKENLRLSPTQREMTRDTTRWPSTVSWCETPKVSKRDAFLRHRLAVCKSIINPNTHSTTSPNTKRPDSSHSLISGQSLSSSLDSLDTVKGTLASSTLTLDLDLPLSGRKRRLLFSQVRTSTHVDDNINSAHFSIFEGGVSVSDTDFKDNSSVCEQTSNETPHLNKFSPASLKDNSQSPVSEVTNNVCDGISSLFFNRSACEDSGFSSLTLDKSQDSSVDHDGSFQELLLAASRGNSETPNVGESRRRSRLQRQHRLSTLKEGGSQSDDDPVDRKNNCLHQSQNQSGTPFNSASANPGSTAALAETPVMFRTTMPLAGLIGRKMGLGQVDILTELKKRNLRHILCVILSHLTPECICRCGLVCRSWNEVILQDKRASFRRNHHLSEVEAALQLGNVIYVPEADTRLTLLKRSALKTVQTQSRSSSSCTPQSGGSTLTPLQMLFFLFHLQVAKTLFSDECLKPCPRCQHPARCHSVKGEGVCSRADCGFQFCMACLCAFHGSRECGSRSVGRCKKDILIPGSAQSKRNVRRL
uniref:F-box protein 43 n=1 Tax=Sphaeramia orbicularis TaxID=375764 RepID=A0A672Y729_9TELE